MSKVGIYQIGLKEQNEVTDVWVQQEELQDRGLSDITLDGIRLFKSIDQNNTDLTEERVMDESGTHYEIHLTFVVRKDEDIEMARKYCGRPVLVYAYAVDGHLYTIGTKSYPAYIHTTDRYRGLDTREMAMTVEYESRTPLLQ